MAAILIVEDNADLAQLLSSVGEMKGHLTRVALSGTEGLVALGQQRFDAAVVDLYLPDVEGRVVLERLKAAKVPVFAMSGVYKSDTFARQAVEELGAVAFFQKPFPILELLRKIEELTGAPKVRPPVPPEEAFDAIAETVTITEPPMPESELEEGQVLPVELAPIDTWERTWKAESMRARSAAPVRRQMLRSGSLKTNSVPHLLNACYQARLRGDLLVKHGASAAIKVMSLEVGHAVYAASNLAHERFARFCARKGLLPSGDLEAVAQLAKEEGLKTGDAMVRLGILDEVKRRQLLEDQVKEIIWSTFAWAEGEFAFAPDKPLKTDVVKIAVFPGQLILEGCLREPLIALRSRVKLSMKLFPAADPPYQLEELKFSGEQAQVIAWADGTKTIADLVALTDLDERETLGLLWGLMQAGLLEQRSEGSARSRRVSFGL
ncbi:MAG: response regulator [Archangiaceae bacterium]|nr:response regulator [Archangiaceae bacterium]